MRRLVRLSVTGLLVALSVTLSARRVGSTSSSLSVSPATSLGTLGGSYTTPVAMSATGYVVGWSLDASFESRQFIWHPSTGMAPMGLMPGGGFEFGGVAASGIVGGTAHRAGGPRPAIWTPQDGFFVGQVPTPPIAGTSEPNDEMAAYGRVVNSSGTVAGTITAYRPSTGETVYGAFSWSRTDGVRIIDSRQSTIDGINEDGAVIGRVETVPGSAVYHAFVWTPAGGLQLLAPDAPRSAAHAISARGQVVGMMVGANGVDEVPFSWTPTGGLVAMPPIPSPEIRSEALAVNAQGEIAGTGATGPSWVTRGFYAATAQSGLTILPAFDNGSMLRLTRITGQGVMLGTANDQNFWPHPVVAAADGTLVDLGTFVNPIGISNSGIVVTSDARWRQVTSATLPFDTVAPDVTLTGVTDGATFSLGQAATVSYTCTDTHSAVVSCAAPAASGALLPTNTPGPHLFTVTATDAFDNVTTHTVRYTVTDDGAPSIQVWSPTNGQQLLQNDWVLLAAGCDDEGGVATCRATDEQGTELGMFSPLPTQPGAHTITITAIDKAGNQATQVVPYTVLADTEGPTITVTSPGPGSVVMVGQSTQLFFECQDPSGVSACQTSSGQGSGMTLPAAIAGTFPLTITATDQHGNTSSLVFSYTVSPRPSATITSPRAGASYRVGDPVTAGYICTATLGVDACVGSVPVGSAIDTSTPGTFTFDVQVTDTQGNMGWSRVQYAVLANDVPPGAQLPTPPPGGYLGSIELPSLGGDWSTVTDVSRNGIVVGQSSVINNTASHGFVWSQGTGVKDLGDVEPRAVSSSAHVVGRWYPTSPVENPTVHFGRAFRWTPAAGVQDLGSAPVVFANGPDPYDVQGASQANDVNTAGWIAGEVQAWRVSLWMGSFAFYSMQTQAAVWSPANEITVLPSCGGEVSRALLVNEAGMVVGHCTDADFRSRVFTWTPGAGLQMLPLLPEQQHVEAAAVNDAGVVVGTVWINGVGTHPFRWSADDGMEDLTPGSADNGSAASINTAGQIVGSTAGRGFVWTRPEGLQVTPDFGVNQAEARHINDSGQILAGGWTEGFAEYHGTFWIGGEPTMADLGLVTWKGLSDTHIAVGEQQGRMWLWLLPAFGASVSTPVATVTTPANGATLVQGAAASADFACASPAGIVSCTGTVADGASIDTSLPGTYAFVAVAVDAQGNYASTTTHYTVVPTGGGGSTPGHMHGDGWIATAGDDNERQRFHFDVLERPTGQHHLRFNFWTVDRDDTPRRTNVFDATSITAIQFSNDPAFLSGGHPNAASVDTVTFRGLGALNGQAGFAFEVSATDQGEPGIGRDTFALTVKDGNGVVVFSTSGALGGGNVQSLRLPNRHFPPFLSGGPQRVHEIEATGPSGAVHTYTLPMAVDESGNSVAVTCTPASGSMFPLGRTRGTCTATDASGRTGRMVFVVVVSDNTAPTFIAPAADITVEATSPQGADVTFILPAATDIVDTDVIVTCTPASGRRFRIGQTEVTCKARDAAHNVSVSTFTVTVRDTVAPVFDVLPANITAEATSGAGRKVTFVKPTATDAADNNVGVACSPASGSTFAIGATTVSCTATDNSGNTATTSFVVTVRDTTAPTIRLTRPTEGASYRQGTAQTVNYSCADDVGVVQCSGPVADGAALNTATVGTFTFVVTARDAGGNVATRSVTYSVRPR